MTKKIGGVGGKKIRGVDSAEKARGVEGTETVSRVSQVKATTGVGGVGGVGGIGKKRGGSREMTAQEREYVLSLIKTEAEKMAREGILPASQKDVATQAVLMAVDAGIVVVDEEKKEGEKEEKKE